MSCSPVLAICLLFSSYSLPAAPVQRSSPCPRSSLTSPLPATPAPVVPLSFTLLMLLLFWNPLLRTHVPKLYVTSLAGVPASQYRIVVEEGAGILWKMFASMFPDRHPPELPSCAGGDAVILLPLFLLWQLSGLRGHVSSLSQEVPINPGAHGRGIEGPGLQTRFGLAFRNSTETQDGG